MLLKHTEVAAQASFRTQQEHPDLTTDTPVTSVQTNQPTQLNSVETCIVHPTVPEVDHSENFNFQTTTHEDQTKTSDDIKTNDTVQKNAANIQSVTDQSSLNAESFNPHTISLDQVEIVSSEFSDKEEESKTGGGHVVGGGSRDGGGHVTIDDAGKHDPFRSLPTDVSSDAVVPGSFSVPDFPLVPLSKGLQLTLMKALRQFQSAVSAAQTTGKQNT